MKLIAALLVAQVAVNSCNDQNVIRQVDETFVETKRVCLERGGVPIIEPVYDAGNATYRQRVARCDFPVPLR